MCGIGGFVDKKGKYNDSTIHEMMELITHRGPDDCGTYHDGAVSLGHRRLSILDLSPDGRQPMTDADALVAVTFNGEIYNYREIKQVLQEKGYHFRTKTDTEVLLAAYQQWGTECVAHFNGMWAFAIWDKHKKQLFCSRDRFGIKPFYYCDTEEVFAFSSEIKQLLMFMEPGPEANRDHLIAFLTNGSLDYSEDTMFQGIKQLPGGYSLLLKPSTGESRITRWYHLDNTPPPPDEKKSKGRQPEIRRLFQTICEAAPKRGCPRRLLPLRRYGQLCHCM